MQILVVDDSSGMRRILTATLARLGYTDTIEAEDAAAAMAVLRRQPVALAMIDWAMPGMSGLDLVRTIRADPATCDMPLLMVTGNGSSADVVRAVRSGIDGYIVKPFTEVTLAQQLRTLLPDHDAGNLTRVPMITANWTDWVASGGWREADLKTIPTPPRSLSDVFALAGENEVASRRLIELVKRDPVFTIRVLRLANIAAFAAAGDVTSVEIAVMRLGTRAVRHAVLAACLSSWAQAIDAYGKRGTEEIQHAVGTACLSRRIAERLRLSSDDAFVHGLLHDVGKLCLLKMRADFRRLGGPLPSRDELEATLATHHAEVGASALQMWGLPESVRVPVRWHHAPLEAPDGGQAAAVTYLANRLSHRYGFGCRPDTERDTLLSDPVCAALGFHGQWLDRLDEDALAISVTAQHLVS
jgi:two-component system chemotaxis response regulator CheY